jgi:hypothetical protein
VPDVNLNQLTAEQLAIGPPLTQQVPNPFYGQIHPTLRDADLRAQPVTASVSSIHDRRAVSQQHRAFHLPFLQTRLEKRFSDGLTLTIAYTFSRLIDDAGAVFDSAILTGPVTNFQAADSFNKRLEKDVSTGSIPHILSSSFVYELPFGRGRRKTLSGWRDLLAGGWQLAGVIRAQSGSPVAVTQATNLNAFAGFGIQRRPCGRSHFHPISEPRAAGSTQRRCAAPQFSIGNSSRSRWWPGLRTADLMLGKRSTTERLRTEFRAEVFNLTNTAPLGNPNGSFGSPAFGTITTALDPRVFELVLKLQF